MGTRDLAIASLAVLAAFPAGGQISRSANVKENRAFVYHGKLVRPNGSTPTGPAIVTLKIYSPDPKLCLLWAENQEITLDKGAFAIELGHMSNRLFGVSGGAASDFKQVFLNNPSVTIPAVCESGNSYTPGPADDRLLTAIFNDGGDVVEIAGLPIKSVPFALQAEEIAGFGIGNLVKVDGISTVTFTPSQVETLRDMLGGTIDWNLQARRLKNVADPVNAQDAATKNWVDGEITARISGAGLGTVTNVSVAGAPLSVSNGSTTPQLSIAQANTANAGYLTSSDWNTFNGKLSAALAEHQVFVGNGSNVAVASYFGIGQLRSTLTGGTQFPSSCTASQTLTWSTITDTLACTSIDNLNADKVTAGAFAPARLGTGAADATKYLRGDGTWQTLPSGADNLGNHTATQNLNLGAHALVGNGGSSGIAISSGGYVGVGTTSPRLGLDVNTVLLGRPAVNNGTGTIDFASGNIQYTNSSCGSFSFHNVKDGGTYTFNVKGTTSSICSFSAFSGAGTGALTVRMPPDHGSTTAGKHTIYSLMVIGTDVYVSWVAGY